MIARLKGLTEQRHIFLFLVAFRWASLLPSLWMLQPHTPGERLPVPQIAVLVLAGTITLLITIFHRYLNQLLIRRPYMLVVDMTLVTGILAISGGASSPYYLYALSPLLAGAFFFQMRGALIAAAAFTPLFLLATALGQRVYPVPLSPPVYITQLAGIWLIAVLFGYPSVLLKQLREAHQTLMRTRDDLARHNEQLATAHQQLKIIHDLTVSLQAAPDVQSVQQRVLEAVTGDLGYARAVVALVNPITQTLGNWRAHPAAERRNRDCGATVAPESLSRGGVPIRGRTGTASSKQINDSTNPKSEIQNPKSEIRNGIPVRGPSSAITLPLEPDNGPLTRALLEGRSFWWSGEEPLTTNSTLNAWLGAGPWFILPMVLREHSVGVLLVSTEAGPDQMSSTQLATLTSVVNQAAVALGTIMLCIDRARRLAVEQERNRIARDIHDTVAQSLFGIVFTLDACIKMLPNQVDAVQQELVELRDLASQVRDEVRRSIYDIWPSALTLERFKTDLGKYVSQCCHPRPFKVKFDVEGEFDRLSPAIRRTLYRVTQEALANAARHSGADQALVFMRVANGQVYLVIEDHGRGFDPQVALAREHNRERFGLRGMRERVQALGGECHIDSQPGQGTRITVRLLANGRYSSA